MPQPIPTPSLGKLLWDCLQGQAQSIEPIGCTLEQMWAHIGADYQAVYQRAAEEFLRRATEEKP